MGKSEHFNRLSPAEAERLALLLEEMGEAQQIIGKTLRHGYESYHPDSGALNRNLLEKELGDVLAALDMVLEAKDVDPGRIHGHRLAKHINVRRYLHHQPKIPSSSPAATVSAGGDEPYGGDPR